MDKTVIILNAPPGCGKDTIADIFVDRYNATKQEFKDGLYEKTAEFFKVDLKHFKHLATSRKYKDNLSSSFSTSKHSLGVGYTPREALIHVSENVYKPKYGSDYFGVLASSKLVNGLNVFSDGGGWWEELVPVAKAADKVLVCKLLRKGFDFDNDSRQYYDDNVPESISSKVEIVCVELVEDKPELAIKAIKNAL